MTEEKRARFQALINEGHSAAWDQDWARAAKAYEEALKLNPNDPKALANLGLAYYQLQEFDHALNVYVRLAKVSPQDPLPFEKIAELSERMGRLQNAVSFFLKAADLYIQLRDVEKALANWVRVVQIDPENGIARQRLAMVHERLGNKQQAVTEYLALASLVQRRGDLNRTREYIQKAMQLEPNSPEVRQAARTVEEGHLLPKPARPRGGTGPIRMAQVKKLEGEVRPELAEGRSLIENAVHQALELLAAILFEVSESEEELEQRQSLKGLMKNTGSLRSLERNRTRIVLHLSEAINAQTSGDLAQAAAELQAAMEAGFQHTAADFDLGYLQFELGLFEEAQPRLQMVISDARFGLAGLLLLTRIYEKQEQWHDAARAALQALMRADVLLIEEEHAAELRALYEALLDELLSRDDVDLFQRIVQNVLEMLLEEGWQERIRAAREELTRAHGDTLLPISELIVASQSAVVLEALQNINQLAREGYLRTAMEEAYFALSTAPTYLPLHNLIGDLLVESNRLEDALTKYRVIARSYAIRGESDQEVLVLRKVVQMAPMDMDARRELIQALLRQEQYAEAVGEYLKLADFYYRLAQLDQAQETFGEALRLAQKYLNDVQVNVNILERMADIDMQRLNWKQALRFYEQIRSLKPDDLNAHRQIVELNLRLGQRDRAEGELQTTVAYIKARIGMEETLDFVETLSREVPDEPVILRTLADLYAGMGRVDEAVALLDNLAERMLNAGDKETAIALVNKILTYNPPNAADYKALLAEL